MRSICLACHSRVLKHVESVSIESLAKAWAVEKSHGEGVTYEMLHKYILSDLDEAQVEFWQCHDCGLELANPMRSWTAEHYPVEPHSLGFDHEVTLSMLATMPPTRVLDVGCADGQFLERAAALGHDLTGIDFAEEDVRAARARGCRAYAADVNEISRMFKEQPKFNVITLFQIIEHLNEPDKIFSQLDEIAEQDALLIVGCPSDLRYSRIFNHPQRIQRSDFWDYPPQHTLRWTPKALDTFLLRHRWQIETTAYEPFSLFGAAAHLAGIENISTGGQTKLRRRMNVLKWMVKMSGRKIFSNTTGIRLLVKARRLNDMNTS